MGRRKWNFLFFSFECKLKRKIRSFFSLFFFAFQHWFDIKKVMKIDHHRGPVVCVAISSTSEVLVSGSTDATICLWSLETYELLNTLQFNSPVINFCLSPDSVSAEGFVTDFFPSWIIYNVVSPSRFVRSTDGLHQIFVLAHCEDNGLYLRTLATGTELHQLKGHKSKVNKYYLGSMNMAKRNIIFIPDATFYIWRILKCAKAIYHFKGRYQILCLLKWTDTIKNFLSLER